MLFRPPASSSIAAVVVAVLVLCAPSAHADGSRELTANGGYRPVLEAKNRVDETTGLARDNQLYVYVNAGESLLTASSAIGVGNGDIQYIRPDGTTFLLSSLAACTSGGTPNRGIIADVDEEVAGPSGGDNVNPGTYDACELAVPAGQSGVWGIRFIAPVTTSANYIASLARAAWTQPTNVGVVLAWDITVRSSGGVTIPGRSYALYFPFSMGSFLATLNSEVFVATRDGYRYAIDQNGMAPFGFVMFANRRGFTAPGTTDKLYRSVTRNEITTDAVEFKSPNTPDNDLRVTHKLFIRPPAADLPASAPIASALGVGTDDGSGGFETWLAPVVRTTGGLTSFSFVGADGVSGQLDPDVGGTFSFLSDADGTYSVAVDVDGNGSFETEVIAGEGVEGANDVAWDGRDTGGNTIPSGQYTFQVTFTPRRGEVHFPFVDAERNVGGTILQRTNGPTAPDFVIYWDDTVIGGTSSLAGTNSSSGAHTWGDPAATEGSASSDFGNEVAIDTWAFVEYSTVYETAAVTVSETDLAVELVRSPDPTGANAPVTYTITVTNNGPDATPLATLIDTFPPELTGVSWSCVVTNPGDSSIPNLCDENGNTASASGVGDIDQEISLSPGAVLTFTVSATHDGSAGDVTNSVSVDPGDASDTVPTNNDDTDTFTPVFTADLSVDVAATDATPALGTPGQFVVTLTNDGPAVATGVVVDADLLGDLGTTTFTPSQGTYDSGTGLWTVGTLQPGQVVTLTFDGTATETPTSVDAQVTASDQADTDSTPNNSVPAEDDQDTDSLVGQRTDLAVDIMVDDASPPLGTDATFTITLSNDGPADATGIDVASLLPAGLTFVSATPAQGTYDELTGVWDVGGLASGTQTTLEIVAIETNPTGSTLSAEVTTASPLDSDSTPNNDTPAEDDQDSQPLTPVLPDLAISAAVSDANPALGTNVTFTFTLDNQTAANATGIDVSALLPPGYTFVSSNPAQGTYDDATGLWDVGALAGSGQTTLEIVATANTTNAVDVDAEVTAMDQPDSDSTPNDGMGDDAATVAVQALPPDLTVDVFASTTTPVLGENMVFTIDLDNEVTAGATGVSVAALLPVGYTFVSASPSQGSYDDVSGNWTVGAVAGTGSAQLQITATPTVTTPATLTAQVTAMDQPDRDSTPGNGIGTEDDQDAVTVQAETIDLELTAAVSDATPALGSDVTFTFTLDNTGPADASGIDVAALLPAGYTFVSATPGQGTYNELTGAWDVGSLLNGGQTTLQVVATVASSTPADFGAEVIAAGQPDGDSTPNNDTPAEDDQDSIGVTVEYADLMVDVSVDDMSPAAGETVVFTVDLTNEGTASATGATLAAALPPGYTFVSSNPSQGAYNELTGVWTAGTLASTGTATLEITAQATAAGTSTFTSEVTAMDQPDSDSTPNNNVGAEDDQDSVTLTSQTIDLELAISVDDATPDVGSDVTFTVMLTNDGPADASGIDIGALLPAGYTFVSSNPDQGSYDDATGIWTAGALASGSSITLEIVATATTTTASSLTAQVTDADQIDADSTPNNSNTSEDDQATVAVQAVPTDLALAVTVDDASPALGETVTFTLTLDNESAVDASGIAIESLLPPGYTFVSSNPAQGAYNELAGLWTVGALAGSGQTTLEIVATANTTDASALGAEVTAADQLDIDSAPNNDTPAEDDQDSVSLQATPSDLALAVTVDDTTPAIGETVTFTLTLDNEAAANASGVSIDALLPAGLTFVSSTPGQGTYNDATGVWTVGALAGSGQTTLEIVATVASAGALSLTGEVSAMDQPDGDSTPGNDVEAEDDQDTATLTGQPADLALTVAASTTMPAFGEAVTFTVTLDNEGAANASGIDVSALLPAGYTFVSSTPAQGTYDDATGAWAVGALAASGQTTLEIVATAGTTTASTFTAEVENASPTDSDSAPGNGIGAEDDQDSVTVTAQPSDLELAITTSDATPDANGNVTLTITLDNVGAADATNVDVASLLPAGLTFVSSTPAQGTYDDATGTWAVGTVAGGGSTTLEIVATVATTSPVTVDAEVMVNDRPDVDSTPGNDTPAEDDQDSVTLTPQLIDLELTAAVSDATPDVGTDVTFTFTLSNEGVASATGIDVTSLLPPGYTFVSSNPAQGTYNGATGLWDLGDLASRGTTTLEVVASVISATPGDVTAQVTAVDQPDTDSTPNNGDGGEDDQDTVGVTPQLPDLAVTVATSDATPDIGFPVTLTVTLENQAAAGATGIDVASLVPAGYTFVSSNPAQGTYDELTGLWDVGALAGTTSTTLEIVVIPTSTGTADFEAEVTAETEPDTDSTPGNDVPAEDDQDALTLTAQGPDLEVAISVDDAAPTPGDDVTFTIELENAGAGAASGVSLTSLLPPGYTFVSAAGATYDDATGLWSVGTVAGGATTTLTLVATATTGQAGTVTAEVIAQDQTDADSTPGNDDAGEDDQASVSVTPVAVDLELTMAIDSPSPSVNDVVTLTLTLENAGGAVAPDAQVSGPLSLPELPAGLEYVGATPSVGTFDPATGVWAVGALAGGATETLAVQVRVIEEGSYDAIAEVLSDGASDVDSTPNNATLAIKADGGEDDDDYLVFSTAGSSGGGTAGLESDGSLAQTLAGVLYARRSVAPTAPQRFARSAAAHSIASPTALRALIPDIGPEAAPAVEVSPTDLLPVTNALDIVAVDYLRAGDARRLGATFATRTAPGTIYEHTKWVCDRLRGSILEAVEVVDLASSDGRSRPVILVRMRNREGQLDYAVSYSVYRGDAPNPLDDVKAEGPVLAVPATARAASASGSALIVDSRYLLSEYTPPRDGDVRNVQMWAVSRDYALELARRSLDALDAEGTPVHYRTATTSPTTPGVFVRQARYERGSFFVELHNEARATTLYVRGGTFSRAETLGYTPFERDIEIPQPEGDDPVVTVEIEVGPIFDAAFFVSTDKSAGVDALYLADGPWGSAADADGAVIQEFSVEPQLEVPPDDGGRYLERPIEIEGNVTTWATAFRYLHAGAAPVDLTDYRYIELTASGRAPYDQTVQVRIETADGNVYGRDIQLSTTPEVQVIWFRDLRDNDGERLTGNTERAVAFSVVAYGDGQRETPFRVEIDAVRFGGANGEEPPVEAFELAVPYPNPTSTRATVAFGLPTSGRVEAHVYDLLGRRVLTLADGEMSAGRHRLPLDSRQLASGVYVIQVRAGDEVRTRRLTVVR